MTMAATLSEAAGLAWDNANVHWVMNNLPTTMENFWQFSISSFAESQPKSRPVSNWLVVIANLANVMTFPITPISEVSTAARAIYGVCWMGQQLLNQGLISSAQATSLLNAYNATFGLP